MLQRAFETRPSKTRSETFLAPTKGWVQSGNISLAGSDQAEVLDNIIPTSQGAKMRGGKIELADLGAGVVQLFTYASGNTQILFGATDSDVFDTADVAGGAVRTGLTSGDWSTTQISTAGGEFVVAVNGADTGFTFNGTTYADLSLTGVTESTLSQVWLFKERLFFVQKDTQSAWYLPVESISGTATEINLGSVFRLGGSLLFGANWSLDSGSGLDDVCLFVSDQGELAVYEGTDPASASTWSLVGVYQIAQPLNKHAFFQAGGDLAILTEDGIVPVSEALRKDRAALQANAISYPIEDAWKRAIAQRTEEYPISATLWQAQTLLLIGTPEFSGNLNVSFVANARTGAWARFTGWDVRCSAVSNDVLYFGDNDGKVWIANEGGTDGGTEYTCTYVPKFSTSNNLRSAIAACITYRARQQASFDLYAHGDFQVDDMDVPLVTSADSADVWGIAEWGTFVWGGSEPTQTFTEWQTAYANGYSLAPALTISSNQTARIEFEILSMKLRCEEGYAL